MKKYLENGFSILPFILGLISPFAHADIVISGTRVIYPEGQKNVSVRLENKGASPLLVQNWLDTGDDNADPGTIKVPFISTPPVSRIESKQGQTVKIMFTGSTTLPNDKESVFWFNVLEVPPKIKDNEKNQNLLQLAFRTRIKLFWRPQGLPGNPAEAPAKLKWKLENSQGHTIVRVTNPTVYHVSFNDAKLQANGRSYAIAATMAAPGVNTTFNIQGLSGTPAGAKIVYSTINDYGGISHGEARIN
ncbi:fimbrial chaperone [Kluyvera sp. STS39-E]|uniref:fimbrial chaperone n=1 Tax=Kluyvera sp. STS39-E TaxID=3234748 RepID=UPI0034C69CF0